MEYLLTPKLFYWLAPSMVAAYIYLFRAWAIRADAREMEQMMAAAETALVPKALLTPNEKEFFGRLKKAAEALNLEVVPQVSMGALLDVSLPQEHPLYWPLRKRFSQKIIDFVLYTKPGMDVLAVVELDDITHDKEKDKQRDAMMAKAGFKTIRWESRAKPSVAEITKVFNDLKSGAR